VIHDNLSNLRTQLGERPIDLFICSASFEDRCKSVVDNLGGLVPRRALVAMNVRLGAKVSKHCDYLAERLGSAVGVVMLDSDCPIASADSISKKVGDSLATNGQRIVIDTTTFTRESLLILLRFLRYECRQAQTVEFLYAHAKEYSIGDAAADKWLSKGIREVRSILGYSGDLLPSMRNHLIILVGFEDERAINLINQFEPAKISLGVGDRTEAGTLPHQDVNLNRCARLKGMVEDVDEFTFKAYDAMSTWISLRTEAAKGIGLNTIIAPMNTKISTIGAAMYAMENEAAQLCYAQPNLYNYERYSTPDDDFYLFSVDGFPR
jgi:hypothetical protein